MPDVVFAIPGDLASPTGGYAYARRMLKDLPAQGVDIVHLPLGAGFPFPTDAELAATAAAFAAIYARFLRGNLIDTLQEDYIRTARAKGLSERRVISRHGVRAAITPIVTLLGLDIGILLGGAILTETVFNIPGIGRYAYNAINLSDLPVIQGTVLFGAFFIVMMSLIVDILYAFIDPRVRY